MQEKYEIELSGKAKEDLKKIVTYIKKNLNEPTIARKYAQLINERIRTLKHIPQRYMIIEDNEIKHLKAHTKVIETGINLFDCVDDFTNGDGTFNLNKYLYFLSVNSVRNRLIGENIKSLIGERSLQIVLTLRVEHAKRIYEELRGEDVILLTSKEKIKHNDYNHKIIVSTFQLFKEGVDIPRADTLHIIAPTSNNVFLVQSIGRIEREAENKKTPLIYFYNDKFYYNEKIKKKLLRLRP